MRVVMMAAAAVLGSVGGAAAQERPQCYDTAVVGALAGYANEQALDPIPVPQEGIFPRVKADALVHSWQTVKGAPMPRQFWARGIMTAVPPRDHALLIFLKSEPDGVPSLVGYQYVPLARYGTSLDLYRAC